MRKAIFRIFAAHFLCAVLAVTQPRAESNNLGDLWFAPNMTSSADWKQLFLNPDSWSSARSKVSALFLTDYRLTPSWNGNTSKLSDAELRLLIERLKSWNMAFGLEAGSVKPWGCTADITSNKTLEAMERITKLEGEVHYIVMDDPLYGGGARSDSCNLTLKEIAQQIDVYITTIKTYYPDVRIGTNDPWPYFDTPTIKNWIDTLASTLHHPLAFFQLDVDGRRAKTSNTSLSQLREIANHARSRDIPFRVIIWNAGAIHPREVVDDATEYQSAMLFASEVSKNTSVDGVALESWDSFSITTTPDSVPNTLTNLLRDYADEYPPAKRTYPFSTRHLPRSAPPIGVFDMIAGTVLHGWSVDKNAPTQPNNVIIYMDGPMGQGAHVATISTTIPRPDVNDKWSATGPHGFSWEIPAQYATASHRWYVYGVSTSDPNSMALLTGSPKTNTQGK
jgi:hypothetical protein